MSFLFPRVVFTPARCAPVIARNDFAPLFSLFDDSFNEIHRATRQTRKQFNPRFDVKEANGSYTVDAELPGIDQKDISIEFTDEHTLTIKGHTERHTESGRPATESIETPKRPSIQDSTSPSETESVKSRQPTVEDEDAPATTSGTVQPVPKGDIRNEPEQKLWVSERRVGEFTRSFSFPSRVDQEAVKASLKNGILSVVIPKAAVPESRRIVIE